MVGFLSAFRSVLVVVRMDVHKHSGAGECSLCFDQFCNISDSIFSFHFLGDMLSLSRLLCHSQSWQPSTGPAESIQRGSVFSILLRYSVFLSEFLQLVNRTDQILLGS